MQEGCAEGRSPFAGGITGRFYDIGSKPCQGFGGVQRGIAPCILTLEGLTGKWHAPGRGGRPIAPWSRKTVAKQWSVAPDSNPEPEQLSGPLSPHHARMGQQRS